MVATNMPIAVNDNARPTASATGASLCSATAAPKTMGTNGRTQGDSIEKKPATNASSMLTISMACASDGLPQERFHHLGAGFARCSQELGLASVDDQGCK